MILPLFLEFIFPISFEKLLPRISDRWNSILTRQYFKQNSKQYFPCIMEQYFHPLTKQYFGKSISHQNI